MTDSHHVIKQMTIKQRRSHMAIQRKLNRPMTDAERRLLDTALTTILNDQRNQVRLKRTLHHRAHHGANPYRLKRSELPRNIDEFAAEYALEAALDHELRLIDSVTV